MTRVSLITLCFLLGLSGSNAAIAQDVHGYAGGAIELSTWGVHSWSGSPSLSYGNTSPDTSVVAVLGEAGWFPGRHVAVGAEINLPVGRNTVTTIHGYFDPFRRVSQYRERSVFGLFHADVPIGARVDLGVVGGGGLVFGSSIYQQSDCNFDPQIPCKPFTPEQEITRTSFGLTGGGELVVHAASHLHVVSKFRVVWVDRGGEPGSAPDSATLPFVVLGLDRVSYRADIGLRATF